MEGYHRTVADGNAGPAPNGLRLFPYFALPRERAQGRRLFLPLAPRAAPRELAPAHAWVAAPDARHAASSRGHVGGTRHVAEAHATLAADC